MTLVILLIIQLVGKVRMEDDVLMYEPSTSSSSGGNDVWSSNWYHTNLWSTGSVQGTDVKAYGYCHSSSGDNPVSWLRTNFINVKDSSVVYFQVTFTMKSCSKYSLPNCNQTFGLHQYQRDKPVGGDDDGDGGVGGGDTSTSLADPDKYPGHFPYFQTITGTKFGSSQNIISVSVAMTKKGVYFALKSNGGCYSVKAVKVTFQTCPEKNVNLTKFNATKSKQSGGNFARGECVLNAAFSSSNGSGVSLECQSNGNWENYNGYQDLQCQCLPGFQNNSTMTACEECPIGYYKNKIGNKLCSKCPKHSNTTKLGALQCKCLTNYYRASWETVEENCTALPSPPRYLKYPDVSHTTAHLHWLLPEDTGNRSDIYYIVSCHKCSRGGTSAPCVPCQNVHFSPSSNLTQTNVNVSGLAPYSSYQFHVTALSGVSTESNKQHWKRLNVSLTTEERAPGPPINFKADAKEEEIHLSWEMPDDSITCELKYYQIIWVEKDIKKDNIITSSVNNYILKDLKPNTEYSIKVRAVCTNKEYGERSSTLKKQTLGQSPKSLMIIISVCASFLFLVMLLLCLFIFLWRRKKAVSSQSKGLLNELVVLPSGGHVNFVDPLAYEDIEVAVKTFAKQIPISCIKMDKLIGEGEFGEVYKGELHLPDATESYPVGIKVLKPNAARKDRDDFLAEASIMGQFADANIVKLEGVVTGGKRTMIVTEFMSNGSLDNFLKDNNGMLSTLQLIGMARGIASGMKYLSGLSFIHRDLAARNILVNENLACKVADFGLSRELEDSPDGQDSEYETRGGKIPVRWTAPESIQSRKFSTASDVWSYGIVMWEIMTFGQRPYWDWGNLEVIDRIEAGYRLPLPMGCPKIVYQIMLDCWQTDRIIRPKFEDIVLKLDELIRSPDRLDKSSSYSDETSVSYISIKTWLEELKMGQYVENFIHAGYVSLDQVVGMKESDLNNIGIRLIGHRRKILKSITAMDTKISRQDSVFL